jgi:aminoglycoside phosphotransferase
MSPDQTKIRVNPRSIGIVSAATYEKHTQERSLKPEAKELARCRNLNIQTAHVKAVELINFDETANRLTTKKVIGQELFHTIWNPTYLLGRLRGHKLQNQEVLFDHIAETGSWLRKYHESSVKLVPAHSNGSWMEAAFHRKVTDIRKEKLIPEDKLIKIEKKFGDELSNLRKADYLSDHGAFPCHIHGDFLLYNILVDPRQNLHVLDFGDTRVSSNLEDVSRFYSGLWAIAQTNSTRRRLFSALPNRFLQAYGVSTQITEDSYFRANLVYNFLTHLEGQFYMRKMLSWNSNREMSQITNAGMNWVYQQI